MGTALAAAGVDLSLIPGVTYCWHHERSAGHALRAEELANGLSRARVPGLGSKVELPQDEFEDQISGKTGIIFFKDYWLRSGETRPTGDHIDLWNGYRMTDWTSWLRIHFDITIDDYWSDLEASSAIWFFPVT